MKTLVQCDFDGTITEEDVSFLLLDIFADPSWREMLKEYMAGKMGVGIFNTKAFAMIKADREALLDVVLNSGRVVIKPGFPELVNYCKTAGMEFVIVSNGQDFYIDALLQQTGVTDVKFFAARSRFLPEGLEVKYIGPDGNTVINDFKENYAKLFLSQGYQIIYIGNGVSDIFPARHARHVFATGDLVGKCRETKLDYTPFKDLHDVIRGLQSLRLD